MSLHDMVLHSLSLHVPPLLPSRMQCIVVPTHHHPHTPCCPAILLTRGYCVISILSQKLKAPEESRSHNNATSQDSYTNALNSLRQRQNSRHFPDDIFKCVFLNENVWISIKIPLKFVQKGPINNIPALIQIMAWRQPGDKPLSEAMMVNLLTHICISRPQWI